MHTHPHIAATDESLRATAHQHARKHRGETALQFHLSQWAEETAGYSYEDNLLMLRAANLLVAEEGHK